MGNPWRIVSIKWEDRGHVWVYAHKGQWNHYYSHSMSPQSVGERHTHNKSPSCCVCVCVYFYMWAAEPVTSKALGYYSTGGKANPRNIVITYIYTQQASVYEERRGIYLQTDTKCLLLHRLFRHCVWWILSFPLIALSSSLSLSLSLWRHSITITYCRTD